MQSCRRLGSAREGAVQAHCCVRYVVNGVYKASFKQFSSRVRLVELKIVDDANAPAFGAVFPDAKAWDQEDLMEIYLVEYDERA